MRGLFWRYLTHAAFSKYTVIGLNESRLRWQSDTGLHDGERRNLEMCPQ